MRKIIYAICIFLNIHVAAAQETTNHFDFRNFDYQAYQMKLQKFLETLTPQEKIIFVMSQSKSSSSSSIEGKIDDIYDKLEEMDRKLRLGSYSLDCNCNCDCY